MPPRVGCSSPQRILDSVLLPAPFSPVNASTSPANSSTFTPSSTVAVQSLPTAWMASKGVGGWVEDVGGMGWKDLGQIATPLTVRAEPVEAKALRQRSPSAGTGGTDWGGCGWVLG